jgi:phosphopantothenoylcysteine decarboxylase/phosphopantothenate--cysteine ligase
MTNQTFQNKTILITAGPSREFIDANSFVSTKSSGKIGYALANYFVHQGAKVILVSGPVCIELEHPNLKIIQVETALEMDSTCCKYYDQTDIAIFSANISTFRAEKIEGLKKINRDNSFNLKMVPNIDIAYEFGRVKKTNQLAIGFSNKPCSNFNKAVAKMEWKNFDMLVLNTETMDEQFNNCEQGKINIIHKSHTRVELNLTSYTNTAKNIVSEIENIVRNKEGYFIPSPGNNLENKVA